MAYTYLSYAAIRTEVANRLGDSGKVFWTDAEIGFYVLEAIRTWQALTSTWRDRGTFNTANNTAFYDIPSKLKKGADFLRPYTIKDQDLVKIIQAHLLEPVTGNSWTGTEMFTLDDLTKAIERRRDQFIVESGCVVTRSTQATAAPPVDRVGFSESIMDVRRVAWIDAGGVYKQLWRDDEFNMSSFSVGWNLAPAVPRVFSVAAAPILSLQLSPPAAAGGSLELLTVNSPALLDPTVGVFLNIPDDFAWVVKWGALADLLGKNGQAYDPKRAQYAEQRYQQGVEMARTMPTVLQTLINNVQAQTLAVNDFDADAPGWQNTTGVPNISAMAGANMIAFKKVPDGAYGITLDVARNAPVPVVDGDDIQMGKEELDALIGYCLHLAMFKQQGDEFQSSVAYVQDFFSLAMVRRMRSWTILSLKKRSAHGGRYRKHNRSNKEASDGEANIKGKEQPEIVLVRVTGEEISYSRQKSRQSSSQQSQRIWRFRTKSQGARQGAREVSRYGEKQKISGLTAKFRCQRT